MRSLRKSRWLRIRMLFIAAAVLLTGFQSGFPGGTGLCCRRGNGKEKQGRAGYGRIVLQQYDLRL